MVKVKIRLFATLREKYGKREIEVDCEGDIEDAIVKASEVLGKEFYFEVFSEKGRLREDRIVNLNGRNLKDLIKREGIPDLKEGDRISIFPPLAGGRRRRK